MSQYPFVAVNIYIMTILGGYSEQSWLISIYKPKYMSTFYYIFNSISNLLYNSNVFEITIGTNKLDRSSDLKGSIYHKW